MLPSFLPPSVAACLDRVLRWALGRPPEPVSFEGLLDELLARWPLDAVEYPERGEAVPFDWPGLEVPRAA